MKINGKISVSFEGSKIDVLWKVLQYYHEVVNNKSNGLELSGKEEEIRDKIHSALWHASCVINSTEAGG